MAATIIDVDELKIADAAPAHAVVMTSPPHKVLSTGEGYSLTFKNVNVSVVKKSLKEKLTRAAGTKIDILTSISGYVQSGHVLAIIGPSGAGKTTLLDALAVRMPAEDPTSIRLNGEVMTKDIFRSHCSYMPQDDRLWPALSVRENLQFAAKLYLPGSITNDERLQKVESVISELGLVSCADTIVGNVFVKGVSGGQKRRASLGFELVGNPNVLFLDEPTSGLDAASAVEIASLLTRLARSRNLLVVASIHQPSSRVFLNFDRVMLLTRGMPAYIGEAGASIDYFAAIGYPCPPNTNPADHLLDMTNSDFVEKKQVDDILAKWEVASQSVAVSATVAELHDQKRYTEGRKAGNEFFRRTWTISQRSMLNYAKDPMIYAARLMTFLMMGLFLGSIYYNIADVQGDVLNRVFLVQWVIAFFSYSVTSSLPSFALERAIIDKEMRNGMYGAASYVVSNTLVQLPFVFLTTLVASMTAYFLGGPLGEAERYPLFLVIHFAFLFVVESLAALLASVISDFVVGLIAANSLLSVFFMLNGFFINEKSVPWVWRWLIDISPHRYASEAMLWTVFSGKTFDGYAECLQASSQANSTAVCYGESGDQILDNLGDNYSEVKPGYWILVLVAIALVLRLGQWQAIRSSV